MKKRKLQQTVALLAGALLLVPLAWGSKKDKVPFKYVAGTESVPAGCEGKLEVTDSALVFQCAQNSLNVPYDSIIRMEYTKRVRKEIRKLKLNWAAKPTSSQSKHQGYFTVLYREKGEKRAMILKVSYDAMRPYLAEIDLKSGHEIKMLPD